VVTVSANPVATAASTALPPLSMISAPTRLAIAWSLTTNPPVVVTCPTWVVSQSVSARVMALI
jgi:hypothetical protein